MDKKTENAIDRLGERRKEAAVVINGVGLDDGQVMALRVAVGNMLVDVLDPGFIGNSPVDRKLKLLYEQRLVEVQRMLVK